MIFQSWDAYFRNVNNGAPPGQAYQSPPTLCNNGNLFSSPVVSQPSDSSTMKHLIDEHLSVQALIRGYQVHYFIIELCVDL